jgi:hypothetical protein
MPLIEINHGTWVRPDRVTAIVARSELPPIVGDKPIRPSVHVSLEDSEQIGWSFDTAEDARAFANRVAAIVNDALKDPPDARYEGLREVVEAALEALLCADEASAEQILRTWLKQSVA